MMAHFSRTSSARTQSSVPVISDVREEDVEHKSDDETFLTEVEYSDENFKSRKVHVDAWPPQRSSEETESSDDDGDIVVVPEASSSPDYDTDLENDFPPEPKLKELKGIDLYEKLCEKLELVPLSCVRKSLNKGNFHMPHRGIGARGVQALRPPLSASATARYVNLENNMIGSEGCPQISKIVVTTQNITDLNLSYNKLGSRGITILCQALKDCSVLLNLDLSNNGFEDKDASLFADIIENNIKLISLNLSKNRFSIAAGKVLGVALANNDTLESLDISWNSIRLDGAQAFAKGIATNLGLKKLNLAMNGFASEGTRAIGIALTLNKYLEELDLSFNRISNAAAHDFARYFKINCTLKVIKLYGNPIMYDGAQEILQKIADNEKCAVSILDLRGLMVHQEFVDLVTQLNAERPFKAEYGIVTHGKNIEGAIDRFADKNPLEILLIFMGEQNLRLVDLFRSFDKDQSGGLTRDEFIKGLQEIQTPLSRAQLDELLDMLDKDGDGEIDLKEILNINREFRDIKMKANRYVQEEKQQKKLEKEGKKEDELGAFTKEALAMKQRSQTFAGLPNSENAAINSEEELRATSALPANQIQPDGTDASEERIVVTKEEAAELNAQIQVVKTKGVLNMWKNKALV